MKVELERRKGKSTRKKKRKREKVENKTRRGTRIVSRQTFPRWPMVAALKADGAPETSSKKKDKESRNDGKEIHAAGRDRPRKGRKTFALGES